MARTIETVRPATAEKAIQKDLARMRDPNNPLDMRLESLDALIGRRDLTEAEKDSCKAYVPGLTRQVKLAGGVTTRDTVYTVENDQLCRRMR